MKKLQLKGRRFTRLLVLRLDVSNRNGYSKWICRCDCGAITSVYGQNLIRSTSKSCGCLIKEITRNRSRTHGMTKTNEYNIWHGIRCRCLNPNDKAFPKYGGRGIGICEEWDSFEVFFKDMGVRPNKKMSIERRDNDLGYSKDNCYWGTPKEQTINRRVTVWFEYDGIRMCQSDWAKKMKINVGSLTHHLKKGKSFPEIVRHFQQNKNAGYET